MSRNFFYWALLIILALTQIYFLAAVRPLGVVPNLVLVAVILAGTYRSATSAVVTALVGGLWLDLASGGQFGLKLAFLLVLALALVLARQNGLELSKFSVVIPVVLVATLLYNLSLIGVVVLAHGLVSWQVVLGRLIVEAGLNVVLLLALKPLVRRTSERQMEVKIG